MKDVFGRELKVNDYVFYVSGGHHATKKYHYGVIVSFAPTSARVVFLKDGGFDPETMRTVLASRLIKAERI